MRDSLQTVSQGVVEALHRAPDLLFTVGGLGPTHDDMTLRGLSIALRMPLVLSAKALKTIEKKYEVMDERTRLTRYRKKMAMLPRGSEPLPNPIGTAPGVLTKTGRTLIVSLPGVPEEMKAIFKGSVVPILRGPGISSPHEAYVVVVGMVESALAPFLEHAQRRFPGLYFKSHPKGRETGVRSLIRLHIYTIGGKKDGTINEGIKFLVKSLASFHAE